MNRFWVVKKTLHFPSQLNRIEGRSHSTTTPLCRYRKDAKVTDSYYHSTSNIPLQNKTIGVVLRETAEKFPQKNAFVYGTGGDRHTYSELLDEVDRLASGFLSLGITKGDRVGICGPDIKEWILTQYATARIGAILVNINPAYRLQELAYTLKKVQMKAIVAPLSYKTQHYYEMMAELCPEMKTGVPGRLKSERFPHLEFVIINGPDKLKGALKFDDVMDMGGDKRHDVEKLQKDHQCDDAINIQFTSGTTGQPKGTILTHHNVVNNMNMVGRGINLQEEGTSLLSLLPLFHCGGSIAGSLLSVVTGSTCVLPSPGPDTIATLQSIQNERCTHMIGTPTFYIDILNYPDLVKYDMSSMTTAIVGGSPCPVDILKRLKSKFNIQAMSFYGMTENSPAATGVLVGDPAEIVNMTVGKPFDHLEVKIADPQTKNVVPINVGGEICLRGYSVMKGYWDEPDKTAETIDEDGWLHTGDLATMNENGYCSIVGRVKDMVIRGGVNLFPAEIEDFLHQHPKVETAQVVGVPDERLGEELCACIKLKAGETCTADEIKSFCKGKITHYKIPRYIEFVESYPMTVSLKVQKFDLQKIMVEKLGL